MNTTKVEFHDSGHNNMNASNITRRVTRCRICQSDQLIPYLDLGQMPLVNRYLSRADLCDSEPHFPLEILLCRSCSLSQLSIVVDRTVLFNEYAYYSSVSQTFQKHCEEMAKSLKEGLPLAENDLVVEIASNDGCLLSKFKALGLRVRGVEPAQNLAKVSEGKGLPTFANFWGSETARAIDLADGKAKLVVATNVLAHVDDFHGFIQAVKEILHPTGSFVFEVPYMVHFIDRTEFDTTYHEHLSYFLLKPLKRGLEANGMQMVDAQEFAIHGGSIRVAAQIAGSGQNMLKATVLDLIKLEGDKGLFEEGAYFRCAERVGFIKEELGIFLHGLKAKGKTIAAYGASAKGNILLNFCGLGRETINFVVDDTPAKQGKFYPGNHLPIVSRKALYDEKPDYLLLLAWNFAEELMKNTSDYGAHGGRYIIPIPTLQVMATSLDKRQD